MAHERITHSRLKELLHYDPETGAFTRKNGALAGTTRADGYKKVNVDGAQCYAHRLAWLYMTGILPAHIDHIDRNPSNNRSSNLRSVSKSENPNNRLKQRNNTSGYKGVVYFKRTKRWRACIWVANAPIYLGYFDTPAEAGAADDSAARIYHTTRPEM